MSGAWVNGVNVERFAKILAKRWQRNRFLEACELPELKSLSGYSEALYPHAKREVEQAIERLAQELLEQQNSQPTEVTNV